MFKITLILGLLASIAAPLVAFAADPADSSDTPQRHKIATCKDGREYWSTSDTHQGACAKHGGVATYADGTASKSRAAKKGEYR